MPRTSLFSYLIKITGWLIVASLSACASVPLQDAQHQFRAGNPEEALAQLEAEKGHASRDQLLRLMEKGSVLHNLGKFEESIKAFLKVEAELESLDYISVSEQAKTLTINEWAGRYKGEYSERLWVHSYQMMNFLLLNRYQEAAVEARMALKVLERHEEPLKQDYFTRALIGLCFEMVNKPNDVLIVYKKLHKDMRDKSAIASQLYTTTRRLGLSGESANYKQNIPTGLREQTDKAKGELILFVSDGLIPKKVSGDIFAPPDLRISFPVYNYYGRPRPSVSIYDGERKIPFSQIYSDLGDIASSALGARGKSIALKQAARVATKHSIVNNLKKDDEVAGEILGLLFFLLEEADTRGWYTLPGHLSLIRIPLGEGKHNISVSGVGFEAELFHLDIQPGEKVFHQIK